MSKTDKTRPWRVQMNDAAVKRAQHRCGDLDWSAARRRCDLPSDPRSMAHTICSWEPVRGPVQRHKMFSDTNYRSVARRRWYSSERAARRTMLRWLTRDAALGGEADEDVIDNRVVRRYAQYGGGWWD